MAEPQQDARSAALADDDITGELIEHRGLKYEVRAPTLAQQRLIRQRSVMKGQKEPDGARLSIQAIIHCTFDPMTGKQVFEQADVEALEAKTQDPRTIVGKVAKALERLMKASSKDAVEEDFEGTPGGSSSSPS